jgi:hypothetical protein
MEGARFIKPGDVAGKERNGWEASQCPQTGSVSWNHPDRDVTIWATPGFLEEDAVPFDLDNEDDYIPFKHITLKEGPIQDQMDQYFTTLDMVIESLDGEEISLPILLQTSPVAAQSLVSMWADLSRISESHARRCLRAEDGGRYKFYRTPFTLEFEDTHAGERFAWDSREEAWNPQ